MNISKKLMLCAMAGLSLSQSAQASQISNTMYKPISYRQADYTIESATRQKAYKDIGKELPFSNSEIPDQDAKLTRKTFTLSAAGNGDKFSVTVTPVSTYKDEEYNGHDITKTVVTALAQTKNKPSVSFSVPSKFSTIVMGQKTFLPTEEICITLDKVGSTDTDENVLLHFHEDFDSLENNGTFYITSTDDENIPMLITQNGKPNVNAIAPQALYEQCQSSDNELPEDQDLGADTASQGSGMISSVESSPLAHLTDKENSFDSVAMPS
jgi:PHD/YefM family antitoxin component YafN of YafNO toxin-antitoxin module